MQYVGHWSLGFVELLWIRILNTLGGFKEGLGFVNLSVHFFKYLTNWTEHSLTLTSVVSCLNISLATLKML